MPISLTEEIVWTKAGGRLEAVPKNTLDLVLLSVISLASAITGAIIGYVLFRSAGWFDKRRELRNIRSRLSKELEKNYHTLVRKLPKDKEAQSKAGSLLSALRDLSF